jgi:hypothetical protein
MTTEGSQAPAPAPEGLQFDKAEFAAPQPGRVCGVCRRPVADEYFEAAGAVLCRGCADQLGDKKGGRAAFLRALLFGGGAALIGTIIWFAIIKLFNMELGLIAIGVGLLVGMAVRRGSGGRGGWKYQTLAIALTYVSITTSYVPLVLKGLAEAAERGKAGQPDDGAGKAPGEAAGATQTAAAAPASAGAPPVNKGAVSAGGIALFFAFLFGIAFAAPFLSGTQNIMGIIIIGIALYEAWKLNRRLPITGPFQLGGPVAPPTPPVTG